MMSQQMQTTLRQNLWWIAGLVACVSFLIGVGISNLIKGEAADGGEADNKIKVMNPDKVEKKYLDALSREPKPQKTVEEVTREDIAKYKKIIEDKDTPVPSRVRHLYATANLTMDNLKDIDAAIKIYEQIILEYPDDSKASRSFFRLYDCYAAKGDETGMRWVCNELMKRYPPDTSEYTWAARALGIEMEDAEELERPAPQKMNRANPEDALEAPAPPAYP